METILHEKEKLVKTRKFNTKRSKAQEKADQILLEYLERLEIDSVTEPILMNKKIMEKAEKYKDCKRTMGLVDLSEPIKKKCVKIHV